jgi:Pyruvate/2-oxoacid:ferredoxin oxidoreductase delta subunit
MKNLRKEVHMVADVYERLAHFLDGLPSGYPSTESGVELRILKRLFTPEEAELAMHLSLIAEEARVVARRAKLPVEEVTQRLKEIEAKGLVFVEHKAGEPPRYMATHYIVGIFEFQVNKLDPELAADLREYLPTHFDLDLWRKAPQMRTIPVGESIDAQLEVMDYERAEDLLQTHHRFSVAPCVCRQMVQVAGGSCDKPLEVCMALGDAAEYYIHNDMGRAITRTEALDVLAQAEAAGLVLQPSNSKDAVVICACCGCCCGVLTSLKRHPKPASVASSAFVAVLDQTACDGCGTCETRCQMEAIVVDNGQAVLDLDRCIGCGLCVTTCPSEALSLVRKPEAAQPFVPKDWLETQIKLGQSRGKLSSPELMGMMVRSKVDRLLAPKG